MIGHQIVTAGLWRKTFGVVDYARVMTPFRFEHTFRAQSSLELLDAYFDPRHVAEQDVVLDITERQVLELEDCDGRLRRVCRVVPRRQLPGFIKPFITGPLHYVETASWRRGEDELAISIAPALLGGRIRIGGTYRLRGAGPGAILRTYGGEVSVDVALIGPKIEREIVAELARSIPRAASSTQDWLDRRPRSVAARA